MKVTKTFIYTVWNLDFDSAIEGERSTPVEMVGAEDRLVHFHRESRFQTEIVLRFIQTQDGNVEHLDLNRFLAAILQVDDEVKGVNIEHTDLKKMFIRLRKI